MSTEIIVIRCVVVLAAIIFAIIGHETEEDLLRGAFDKLLFDSREALRGASNYKSISFSLLVSYIVAETVTFSVVN